MSVECSDSMLCTTQIFRWPCLNPAHLINNTRNMPSVGTFDYRFFVQANIHHAFVAKLKKAASSLVVGDGVKTDVTQGSMIDDAAVGKVEDFIADATDKGGYIVQGGKRHKLGGNYFEPTIITGASNNMKFASEDIFGPLAAIFKFEDEGEAINAANAAVYGPAAYAFTGDVARVFRRNDELEYGLIGINSGLIATVEVPFGELKESGLGGEGGSRGLDDYLETKYVCVAGVR